MSIQSTISMMNKTTPVLNSIISSMDAIINTSYEVSKTTGDMINTQSLMQAGIELDNAKRKLYELGAETTNLPPVHEGYNQKIKAVSYTHLTLPTSDLV